MRRFVADEATNGNRLRALHIELDAKLPDWAQGDLGAWTSHVLTSHVLTSYVHTRATQDTPAITSPHRAMHVCHQLRLSGLLLGTYALKKILHSLLMTHFRSA